MADLPRRAYFFRFAAVFFFAGAFLATFFFGAAFFATFFTVFFTTFLAGAFLTVFLTAFFATFFFAAINVCGENSLNNVDRNLFSNKEQIKMRRYLLYFNYLSKKIIYNEKLFLLWIIKKKFLK